MKRYVRLTLLSGAIPFLASVWAHAEPQSTAPPGRFQADFPAFWMEQMIQAYEHFKATHDDLSCFQIVASRDGDSYFVSIESKTQIEIEGSTIKITRSGWTPCGYGANYEFDNTGKFIKKTGIR